MSARRGGSGSFLVVTQYHPPERGAAQVVFDAAELLRDLPVRLVLVGGGSEKPPPDGRPHPTA